MPKPRRRTLSHSEIENFLSEISQVSGENHVNKQAKQADSNEFPTKQQHVYKSGDDFAPVRMSMEDDVVIDASVVTAVPPPPPSEADLIREYCKIKFRPSQCQHESLTLQHRVVEISKSIHNVCKYKLVSSRLMFPEDYPHPSTSIESKKSLLISLSPMLTEAEDQRKKDTKECEDFTRCRSSRGRGRSNYEYIDMDTNMRVDFAEFERRYMMFIYRNKVSQVATAMEEEEIEMMDSMVSAEELVDTPETVVESTTITTVVTEATVVEEVPQIVMDDGMSEEVPLDLSLSFERKRSAHGDRKRKHNSAVDRRGTLSPASAKAMLLNAVEEEAAIDMKQQGQSQQSAIQTPPVSPVRTVATSSSTTSTAENTQVDNTSFFSESYDDAAASSSSCVSVFVDDDFLNMSSSTSSNAAGGRSHRYVQRRNTLSPSSAKSYALELIEKEEQEALMMANQQSTSIISLKEEMTVVVAVEEEEEKLITELDDTESESSEGDLLAFQDDVDTECSSSTSEMESEVETEPETEIENAMDTDDIDGQQTNAMVSVDNVVSSVVVEEVEDDAVPVSQLDEILFSQRVENDQVPVIGVEQTKTYVAHESIHDIMSAGVGSQLEHEDDITSIDSASVGNVIVPTETISTDDITTTTTDFEELLDEKVVLNALVPTSPTSAISAFFGRKSEIAEILKIAMNIFEEDEHELTIFEKMENLVESSSSKNNQSNNNSNEKNVNSSSAQSKNSMQGSVTSAFKMNLDDIPNEFDADALEAAANKRMKERIVIARNKYLWEVVSTHAANAAIRRLKNKMQPQQ